MTITATTLCTDVLKRSASLLLLPIGYPPWSDRAPAFVWWGNPTAVTILPQLLHRKDSIHQDPIRNCLTIADGTNDPDRKIIKRDRLHVCLRLSPAANALASFSVTNCVSPPAGLKELTSLELDVTTFGEATRIDAWIQIGPQVNNVAAAAESWRCCETTTMVIAPSTSFVTTSDITPGTATKTHRTLTQLRNVRRTSEWMEQSITIDDQEQEQEEQSNKINNMNADDTAFEVGYLAGVDIDHWWFHPSKSLLAYRIFDTNLLYSTGDGYTSHQSNQLPKWSRYYAKTVLRYCEKMSASHSCKSFIEFGSASCYVTAALRDALSLDTAAPESIDFLAIEAAQAGVNACHERGISNVVQHDLRLPFTFTQHDNNLSKNKRYDIAICTEVAEHIEPPFASQLVLSLVQSSDIIWWSSALPRSQKPWFPFNHVHHMNEQHDDFWIHLFAFFGYDFVRPMPLAKSALKDFSKEDDQALRQRGRLIFYNRMTVTVKEDALHRLDRCDDNENEKEKEKSKSEQGDNEKDESERDICLEVLDVYGLDDDGKYDRWLDAWN